jgi:hypothetical protein
MSRWARSVGLNDATNGSGLQPLDQDEARAMLERTAPPPRMSSGISAL